MHAIQAFAADTKKLQQIQYLLFFFLFKVTTEHNHLPDEARINVQEANQDIRQRARESQDAPAVIRAEVMANMPDDRSRDVSKKLIFVNLK